MTPRQRGLADEAAALNAASDVSTGGSPMLASFHDEAAQLLADVMSFSAGRLLSAGAYRTHAETLGSQMEAVVGVNPLDVDTPNGFFTPEINDYAGGDMGQVAGNIASKAGDVVASAGNTLVAYLAIAALLLGALYIEVRK